MQAKRRKQCSFRIYSAYMLQCAHLTQFPRNFIITKQKNKKKLKSPVKKKERERLNRQSESHETFLIYLNWRYRVWGEREEGNWVCTKKYASEKERSVASISKNNRIARMQPQFLYFSFFFCALFPRYLSIYKTQCSSHVWNLINITKLR